MRMSSSVPPAGLDPSQNKKQEWVTLGGSWAGVADLRGTTFHLFPGRMKSAAGGLERTNTEEAKGHLEGYQP